MDRRCAFLCLLAVVISASPALAQTTDDAPLALNSEPGAYTHIMRWKHGVQPLTAETLKLAMRANTPQGGYSPEADPFVLRTALINARQFKDGELSRAFDTVFKVEQAMKALPYKVRVMTPFMRVAQQAEMARYRYEALPTVNVAAENKRGISIVVSPTSVLSDPIERVIVKRGATIHKHVDGGTVPVAMRTLLGIVDQSGGLYFFPLKVFAPDDQGPLSIVFIGSQTTSEWLMTTRELQALR